MKIVQRAIRLMACGAALVAVQPALADEVQPGFYFGVSGGESSFDIEKSELDVVVRSALLSEAVIPLSGASSFEDSDTSLALFGGYHFNQYIAVEAGYLDLGAAEYRWSGTVNPPGPVLSSPSAVSIDVESKGFTLAALGSLPIGTMFNVHGHLGFFFAETDLTVGVSIASAGGADTETLDSIGGMYGVGAGFNFGQHWSLSLDWTRYDNVGDEEEDDDTEGGFDIDALSFSAMYRF